MQFGDWELGVDNLRAPSASCSTREIYATATQGDTLRAAAGARSQAREAIRRCRRSATRKMESEWRDIHVDGAVASGVLQDLLAGQHPAVDGASGARELLSARESYVQYM